VPAQGPISRPGASAARWHKRRTLAGGGMKRREAATLGAGRPRLFEVIAKPAFMILSYYYMIT